MHLNCTSNHRKYLSLLMFGFTINISRVKPAHTKERNLYKYICNNKFAADIKVGECLSQQCKSLFLQ